MTREPGEVDLRRHRAIIDCMASVTIRNLDPRLKERLRLRAAKHGRSMEEELRVILRITLDRDADAPPRLGSAIRRRFGSLGGVDLDLPGRGPIRTPPKVA